MDLSLFSELNYFVKEHLSENIKKYVGEHQFLQNLMARAVNNGLQEMEEESMFLQFATKLLPAPSMEEEFYPTYL